MRTHNKLYIFDLDDTLITSSSHVYVKKLCGGLVKLTSSEYATYKCKPNEECCFAEFDRLVNPTPYKLMNTFKRVVEKCNGNKVYILTARNQIIDTHVHEYFKSIGIRYNIPVVGLGSSNPNDKASWIVKKINELGDVESVHFYDDSIKNVKSVRTVLSKYKDVKYRVQHVK